MNTSKNKVFSTILAGMLVSACGSEGGVQVDPPGDLSSRGLDRLGSESEFYVALRDGLKAQSPADFSGGGEALVVTQEVSTAAPVANTPPSPMVDANTAESASDSQAGSGIESSGNEVTGTNVQVQGVDEQDWVKVSSSGNELFILQSENSYDYPVGPVEPGVEPAVEPLTGSGLALSPRLSVAIPHTYLTRLRVLSLDNETPDSTSLSEFDLDLSGRYAEGFYLYEKDSASSVLVTSSGSNYWQYWDSSTAFSGVDSVITQIDVTNPADPTITGSLQFDGQIISSRRIGNQLFFASRYYPTLPGEEPWNQSPEVWAQQVDSTDLSTVLPTYITEDMGSASPLIDPSSCFVAATSDDSPYYSPDIITLGVVDLDTMQLSDTECFLGSTETLYASPNAVFLATTRYAYFEGPISNEGILIDVDNGEFPVDAVWVDPRAEWVLAR